MSLQGGYVYTIRFWSKGLVKIGASNGQYLGMVLSSGHVPYHKYIPVDLTHKIDRGYDHLVLYRYMASMWLSLGYPVSTV